VGFIEQILGMEKAATPTPYRQSLSGMGPRGSSTAKPEIKTSAMQAMVDSPIGSLLQLLHADVPGKLESGLKAVGDSYKKAIDTSLSLGPTVMSGTAPPEATDQYNKVNLELVAEMAGLGAFSEVPKGALRMFGGRSAKTADQAALQQAQDLTAKGADRNQVWKETGWYKDVDGQWKFEIDDSASFLETPAGAPKGYQRLQHDELQGAYPDMWDATQQSISRGPIGGEYDPSFKTVVAKGSDNAERRSVANHEFQHATQETENFSRGGNPETARDSVTLDYHRRAGVHYRDKKEYDSHKEDRAAFMQADYYTKLDELSKAANPKPSMVTNTMDWYRWSTEIRDTIGIQPKKAGPARDEWVRGAAAFLRNKHLEEMNGSLTSSQINKFNSVMGDRKQAKAAALKAGRKMEKLQPAATKMRDIDKLRKAHDQRTDFELYQRLAGEAEARNVQTRMDYTPEQRRATPPWDTLDVPENELIVR
tara:strand:+ start:2014 stop:3450 length:1437 start_codon:yes stop_codon:yes gene_type:complete